MLPPRLPETAVVGKHDLEALPKAVQRFFGFMKVTASPRVWSFMVPQTGIFRMRPDRPWMKCETWQYDASPSVCRVFHMRLRMLGLLPIYVRDTYLEGRGRMLGRAFDRISVVDVADEKVSTGELVTYVNDAILFAPSLLLGLNTEWQEVDADSFDVKLNDRGRAVSARVFLDERGAPRDFSTTCRYGEDPARPGTMVQARWSTPIHGFTTVAGRVVATGGKAVWHFPSGDFTYADFALVPNGLRFNVSPTSC